jgi:hypothetical protein
LLENQVDGGRADRMAGICERPGDVVNRIVLLTKRDSLLVHLRLRGSRLGAFRRRQKEQPLRILAKFVAEDAEAGRGIAEFLCGLGGRKLIDKVGAESLILAMRGVGGGEKRLGQLS